MAICIYKIADGSLQSYCQNDTDPVADDATIAAQGFGKYVGLAVDNTHAWDPLSKTVIVVAAVLKPRLLATFDLINTFTPAEWAGVVASANTSVKQFLFMLQCTPQLDMNNTNIPTKIQALVTLGLLTQIRADAIKAAVAT